MNPEQVLNKSRYPGFLRFTEKIKGAAPEYSPVILAPMAGITNAAFRQLCRELTQEALTAAGLTPAPGLYVNEMVTSRALVERSPESMRLITPAPGESPRSIQLYGVDPVTVGLAVRMLVAEDRVDHLDLNFGCPVPKVTRKGGGSALPWKLSHFRNIVETAIREAAPAKIPVTIKMRKGIDADHLTYLEAARIAVDAGVAAIGLHARTAEQYYSGVADWSAITKLKAAVPDIPILGNGDIWSAADAQEMMRQTGCDGVVIGRGCLGRPWIFADLAAAFHPGGAQAAISVAPGLAEVARVIARHVALLAEHYSAHVADSEAKACRDIRKHISWYLKGFSVRQPLRAELATVASFTQLDDLLGQLRDQPWPGAAAEGQRGRAGSAQRRVLLPHDWLASRELSTDQAAVIRQAELSISGG